jgi:hypothetical protein
MSATSSQLHVRSVESTSWRAFPALAGSGAKSARISVGGTMDGIVGKLRACSEHPARRSPGTPILHPKNLIMLP